MPRYYPICLDLTDLPCLVVGGGSVGLRKIRTLLEHGARVTVVAVQPDPAVKALADEKKIALAERGYETGDLEGKRLIFVATNDPDANRRITSEARERGILINVVDVPEQCDFIVPSIVRRGPLFLAISTEGACPAYSKRLRKRLEEEFDDAYGEYVEMLRRLRRDIIVRFGDSKKAAVVVRRLLDEELIETIREEGARAAEERGRALLEEWLKEGESR